MVVNEIEGTRRKTGTTTCEDQGWKGERMAGVQASAGNHPLRRGVDCGLFMFGRISYLTSDFVTFRIFIKGNIFLPMVLSAVGNGNRDTWVGADPEKPWR